MLSPSSSSSSLSSLCLTLLLITQPALGQYVREPVPGYTFDEFVGDDLGVRFNKIVFIVPDVPPPGPNPLPFGPDDYPITLETAEWLRQTKAVSVFQQDDCFENDCNIDIQTLVLTIKHLLTYPSSNPNHFFWGEFYDVVLIQKKRLENEDPSKILALPHIWSGFDIHQVAEAVHDEYPGLHHQNLIMHLLGEGAQVDRQIIPTAKSYYLFVRGVFMLAEVNTWATSTVGPQNFQMKWYMGRPRPEEVAYKIKMGEIPADAVPTPIHELLQPMSVANYGRNFTAYPEGSPRHPAFPAMHSAASAASMWMPIVMDLTPQQICEVKKVDYAISFARTVAGVHYSTDNIAGLQLGQEIIARKLPRYLASNFGGDIRDIRRKISEIRFQWEDYENDPVCFPTQSANRRRNLRTSATGNKEKDD